MTGEEERVSWLRVGCVILCGYWCIIALERQPLFSFTLKPFIGSDEQEV